MLFNIITLGCKVNTYESEFIKSSFLEEGFVYTDNLEDAHVIVINTCSVTNQADNKSAKMIRHAKKNNQSAILVVCGCSSEYKRELYEDLGIDILLGTNDKSKIVEYVLEYQNNHQKIVKFEDERNVSFEDMKITNFHDRTRAFIKIQDGCNNFCSYCVIPLLRKNIRSKNFSVAVNEIKEVVNNGFKEIVLTGIHTGSFYDDGHDLTDLIHEISKIDGLEHIRISSIEATELNDKFLDEFKNNPKICNHLHIPIQSGSDTILKAMNRKYNKEFFINKINRIRQIRPDVNITTDCIVGFPGETTELFNETLDTIKTINFSKVHVFPYSRRNNTKAASLPDQVDEALKKKRALELIRLSDNLSLAYNQSFIGKTVKVLIETSGDTSVGHSSNYLKVLVNDKLNHNEFYDVLITDATSDACVGELK